MTDEEAKFRHFLREEGMKTTRERKLILEEVFRNHQHFEADDIVSGLRKRGKRVSRASVYRTLPLLVNSGLLREVDFGERHGHYEHVLGHGHHDHLICTACGRTFEFNDNTIEELQQKICEQYSFKAHTHELRIMGLCSECANS
ncbi:MAG: transcriptional repressor [Armatimonadetes bacterium]|nr:transcriptional repressor [Armatimonadota bacterium]